MQSTFEREGTPPLAILERLVETDPEFAMTIPKPEPSASMPEAKPLGSLIRHPAGNDPAELIKHRFLCRGGSAVLVGPTGVGKSSLTMQMAILWSLGRPCFGLEPARPLRVLIIQAENDDGDLAEMRDGVLSGLNLSDQERREASERVTVVTEDSRTREGFAQMLDLLLQAKTYDLVICDPAFAYIGGDASSQRDVSPFLRNMLNPVIHKHNIGFILVHHVSKPPQGPQKSNWVAGDFAYLGSGSAEFANWARAVIALRNIGSDSVFELLLAKRGRRAGWKDELDRPSTKRLIAYHRDLGTICWREATMEESLGLVTITHNATIEDVTRIVSEGAATKAEAVAVLKACYGIGKSKAYEILSAALAAGAISVTGPRNKQILAVTEQPVPASPGEVASQRV